MPRRNKPIRNQVVKKLAIALRYSLVSIYFLFWSYKTELRRWFKIGSLGILSIFMLGLLLEVAAEIVGPQKIHELILFLGRHLPHGKLAFVIFSMAVSFMVWHHVREAKKPAYEYTFVKSLLDFMEGRRPGRGDGKKPPISDALELFYLVFKRAGLEHVSIYTLEDAVLKIKKDHVFPQVLDDAFFVPLKIGEGVAGRVFEDTQPRYAPKLLFPFGRKKRLLNVFFPHAVKFIFRQLSVPGETLKRLELGDELLDFDIFKSPSAGKTLPFCSFLSVPLKSAKQDGCVGVLNFDFSKPDPLDKADIAMAVIFGLLLGAEMK